jgi:metal-dependent amidase/aminoacylase/carboxypeptidase family protein
MVTRQFDIFDPVVFTVGRIIGGTKENIIPDEARFDATIRTFTPVARDKVQETVTQLCQGVAAAHGLDVDINYHRNYPPTINNDDEAQFLAETVIDVFGEDRWSTLPNPHPGAEDFSRILEAVPGSYVFFGTCATGDPATAPSNHASTARFDDQWLTDGATLLAELAVRRMARG